MALGIPIHFLGFSYIFKEEAAQKAAFSNPQIKLYSASMYELKPILNEFLGQPVAFFGGLVSGFLKLDLQQDPLKGWLEKQGATSTTTTVSSTINNDGPQSISID